MSRAEKYRTSDLACGRPSAGSARLVSLWDMLRVHSEDFYILTTSLRVAIDEAGKESARYKRAIPHDLPTARKMAWDRTSRFLNRLEPICRKLELNSALDEINHLRSMNLTIDRDEFFHDLHLDLARLPACIGKEFPNRMLMFVPDCDAKYLADKLFGETVYDKYPKSRDDIANAGRCLALESSDGAVYYLMRVLEPAIKRLAKNLRVPAKGISKMTWGDMLKEIRKSIHNIPARTPRQQMYSELAAHLGHCKDAWRDPVSHTRKPFTKEEAIATFEHVKTFMKQLAGSTA